MLQDMDHIEASCIFHVAVGMPPRLEQSKIYVVPITKLGIAKLTVHHSSSVSFNIHGISRDKHQQTSFQSNNVQFISHKSVISTVVHRDLSL